MAAPAPAPAAAAADSGLPRRRAVRFIVLLGCVSLFGDMTYESARSITGPYLALLGATGTAVGVVAGLGELVGYAGRLASGWLSDRTGRYWAITIAGYVLNLLAVPLLALTGRWEVAALLIVLERAGRAVRSPARDAMLSHAASRTGLGWGFGLHEALDQVGAVAGPLVVAAVLRYGHGYREAFAVLLAPAVLSLALLVAARVHFPRPRDFDLAPPPLAGAGLPRRYWAYLAAVACVAAGYADYPLVAFHFGRAGTVPAAWIPLLYAIAMATDAVAALALGRLFDRIGFGAVALATVAGAAAAPLVFLGGMTAAAAGMALWGIGLGAQESIMRAAVAAMAPTERRGTAYGLFNAVYGLAWFAGSVLLGVLYDRSVPALVIAALVLQLAAVPALLRLAGRSRGRG